MSLRISSVALALLAVACRAPTASNETLVQPEASPSAAAEKIMCAVGGKAGFAPACAIERVEDAQGTALLIRHPDGGFRRLRQTADGGIVAADGAEAAIVTTIGDQIEVRIGADRYRLPQAGK